MMLQFGGVRVWLIEPVGVGVLSSSLQREPGANTLVFPAFTSGLLLPRVRILLSLKNKNSRIFPSGLHVREVGPTPYLWPNRNLASVRDVSCTESGPRQELMSHSLLRSWKKTTLLCFAAGHDTNPRSFPGKQSSQRDMKVPEIDLLRDHFVLSLRVPRCTMLLCSIFLHTQSVVFLVLTEITHCEPHTVQDLHRTFDHTGGRWVHHHRALKLPQHAHALK